LQEFVSPELARVATESVIDEFTDHTVYSTLARREKNPEFKKALQELADSEQVHLDFWKRYAPDFVPRVGRLKLNIILFLRFFLGLTFTLKFLERHEDTVIRRYRSVEHLIPESDKRMFDRMLDDEEHHENYLMGEVHENRVKYISFVVLGLADAVVEISGIHAGSLGVFDRTELAGISGVVAGMAASIAMASAAYAQAKQGFQGSAKWGAIYTGVSYMFTAIFLALPYFLTGSMLLALGTSITVGVVLVAMLTYYDTIISSRGFARQFGELAGIILGASFALFVAGTVLRQVFGIVIG
jgi:VIT1/CCC1 family predicted Fe2+/Mn2+ transporter